MINLFLDSQIWLDLYYFSNDDLTQFNKLYDMLDKDVRLFITEQIKNEVKRNRENKIKEALKQFREIKIQFPNLCKGYDAYQTMKQTFTTFKAIHKDLIIKLEEDIEKEALYADKIINKFFQNVNSYNITDEIINKAIIRYKLGNPPGKENSYGDAINWEILLATVNSGEDLFFVSSDKDFRSPISDNKLNKYLYHEWKQEKNSEIFFYTSLTMFLDEHIEDIKLKSEIDKNQLIEALKKSPSFATTHRIIEKLNEYTSWSECQASSLFSAADYNNQISSIIDDDDIKYFYTQIYKQHPNAIEHIEDRTWILKKLGIAEENLREGNIDF